MIDQEKTADNKWHESPLVVLGLLFFVLGPLALPLLYKSNKFSLLHKVILTVLVIGLTVYVFHLMAQMIQQINNTLDQLNRIM